MDLLQYGFESVVSLPYDVLNNIFFSVAYFIVRTQYTICITHQVCASKLLMLLVRLPVNSSLLVVKFFAESKVIHGILTAHKICAPSPMSFKDMLIRWFLL